SRVLFAQLTGDAPPDIFSVATAGAEPAEKVCERCGAPTDWSANGRWIVLETRANAAEGTISALDRGSGHRSEILATPRGTLSRGRLSPDARWIAFHAELAGGRGREMVAPVRGARPAGACERNAVADGTPRD